MDGIHPDAHFWKFGVPLIIEAQKAWKNLGGLEITPSFFQGNRGGWVFL